MRRVILILLLLLLAGCVKDQSDVLFDEQSRGRKIKITKHHKIFVDSDQTRLELWFDEKKLYERNWDEPESHRLASSLKAYGSAPQLVWNRSADAKCLYFEPTEVSPYEFTVVADAFSKNTASVTSAFGGQLGAIVYGSELSFSECFVDAKGYRLAITPDRQVYFYGGGEDLRHLGARGNLLPDKNLLVVDPYIHLESLSGYKNSVGKSVTDIYKVRSANGKTLPQKRSPSKP